MPTDTTWVDIARAVLVLALVFGQVLMAYWPQLRKWPHTIPSRSAELSTPAVPVEWAFAIWGIIFIWCVAFAIWHALPSNLADPLLRSIGWSAAIAFAVNMLWEWMVPRRGLDWASVAIILVEVTVLLGIVLIVLGGGPLGQAAIWFVAAPFLLFSGWVSAATFVNLSSTAKGEAFDPFRLGEAGNATVLVAAASVMGATVAWLTGSWLYAGAVGWALFGIGVANARSGPRSVLAASALGICLVLACGLLSPNNGWLPA